MRKVRVAIVGVGNCASSLVQGVSYYADPAHGAGGLIHDFIGDYGPADIEFVLAFDTDSRKVGLDLSEAIFAAPIAPPCSSAICRRAASSSAWARFSTAWPST